MKKIAIIGSGPSAFYAAQALFKSDISFNVDMFEKLPTPFGLLRGGVAPDHQQMKTVSKLYDKIATNDNFRFFGNVEVGKDIEFDQLKKHYHAVIVAVGAETDRRMNIPGEEATGSHTATEFVAWYNGQPNYQSKSFDLSGKNAIVIGQGNVAVDVTRILSKPIEILNKTDITDNAIQFLKNSSVKDVYMIGRRGPAQAAFTELELKELGKIEGVNIKIHDNLDLSKADQEEIAQTSKARKNVAELNHLKSLAPNPDASKTIHIMFYSSPIEIIETNNQIKKVKFQKNKLEGNAGGQKAIPTDDFFELECDILFRSIGYRGVPFKGLPFDDRRGVIPNNGGQVIDSNNLNVENVYVTGWIKRGPSGVIGTNRSDSIETVNTLLNNIQEAKLIDNLDMAEILKNNEIQFLTYDEWKIIDQYEIKAGEKVGKPREKITSIKKIMEILKR